MAATEGRQLRGPAASRRAASFWSTCQFESVDDLQKVARTVMGGEEEEKLLTLLTEIFV